MNTMFRLRCDWAIRLYWLRLHIRNRILILWVVRLYPLRLRFRKFFLYWRRLLTIVLFG